MSTPVHISLSNDAWEKRLRSVRHNLYDVDLEHKTAFCTVCGWTAIHASKTRTGQKLKILCIQRFQESSGARNNRTSKIKLPKSNRKSRHVLSEIDVEKRRGVCSICGSTDLEKRTNKKSTYYYCATNIRAEAGHGRRVKRSTNISNLIAHKLSQIDIENKLAVCLVCGLVDIYVWRGSRKIDMCCSNASVKKGSPAEEIRKEINIQIINDYKVKRGCAHCGYKRNPMKLYLCNRNPKTEETYIARLLRLTRKDLMTNLDNCKVYCVNCP